MVSTPGFLPGNPSSNLGSFTSMNRFGCTRDGKIRQNNTGTHVPRWRDGFQNRLAGFDSLGVCWGSSILNASTQG